MMKIVGMTITSISMLVIQISDLKLVILTSKVKPTFLTEVSILNFIKESP